MPASLGDAIPPGRQRDTPRHRGAGSISLTRQALSSIADERRVEVAASAPCRPTTVSAPRSSIAESRSISSPGCTGKLRGQQLRARAQLHDAHDLRSASRSATILPQGAFLPNELE